MELAISKCPSAAPRRLRDPAAINRSSRRITSGYGMLSSAVPALQALSKALQDCRSADFDDFGHLTLATRTFERANVVALLARFDRGRMHLG
jgi:hypothetical protein